MLRVARGDGVWVVGWGAQQPPHSTRDAGGQLPAAIPAHLEDTAVGIGLC